MSTAAIHRFYRSRWSETRKAIDSLEPDEGCVVPLTEKHNADTSMRRLAYAYDGQRKFTMRSFDNRIVISRVQ